MVHPRTDGITSHPPGVVRLEDLGCRCYEAPVDSGSLVQIRPPIIAGLRIVGRRRDFAYDSNAKCCFRIGNWESLGVLTGLFNRPSTRAKSPGYEEDPPGSNHQEHCHKEKGGQQPESVEFTLG